MAEEHRFESQENHILCPNNCGFFGSPATLNLCSKCYSEIRLKEDQASSAKIAVEKSFSSASSSSFSVPLLAPSVTVPATTTTTTTTTDDWRFPVQQPVAPPTEQHPVSSQPNRCSSCRKRVGLTGFRCRCGITFCSTHRYPEQHGCTFDFKAVGREAIAKANPLVKGEKLQKI